MGEIIDDKYEVLAVVGQGGFGTVYKARQLQLDRIVALKVLHKELLEDNAVERLQREAQALGLMQHKNLIGCYGHGVFNGRPYIISEFIDGEDLQHILEEYEPGLMPLHRTLDIMIQVANGLACAHAQGIIHRDLKPSNILISKDKNGVDIAHLVDFGLIKFSDKRAQALTDAGVSVGTPQFMSPEQCLGEEIDARTDIYAYGCILYTMVTGKLPFTEETYTDLMFQHVSNEPVPIDRLIDCNSQKILDSIATTISKATRKKPDDRYANMTALLEDLEQLSKDAMQIGKIDITRRPHKNDQWAEAKQRAIEQQKHKGKNQSSKVTIAAFCATAALLIIGAAVFICSAEQANLHLSKLSQNSADLAMQARKVVSRKPPDTGGQLARARALNDLCTQSLARNDEDHLLDLNMQISLISYQVGALLQIQREDEATDKAAKLFADHAADMKPLETAELAVGMAMAAAQSGRAPVCLPYCRLAMRERQDGVPVNLFNYYRLTVARVLLDCGKQKKAEAIIPPLSDVKDDQFPLYCSVISEDELLQKHPKQALRFALKGLKKLQAFDGRLAADACMAWIAMDKLDETSKFVDMLQDYQSPTAKPAGFAIQALRFAKGGDWEAAHFSMKRAYVILKERPAAYAACKLSTLGPRFIATCRQAGHQDIADDIEKTNTTAKRAWIAEIAKYAKPIEQ